MLQQIREFTGKRIVRWAFIIFLVVPFGLFGIDAYVNRVTSAEAIASVGDAGISQQEYDQALQQQAEIYRSQFRNNFDPAIMENPEVRRGVLDRLVNEKLLAIGSLRAGIRIPDKALAERIASEPFFQQDGRFSKERYEQFAASQGMTPVGLDERLRSDFRLAQFRSSIADTAIVPRTTLDNFIKLSEQTREVSVVNFASGHYLDAAKVSDEQVAAYYEKNKSQFVIPERVRVEYVELSLDALAAKAQVPAEEVKRAYEDGMKRNQWGRAEERRASHILVTVAPDAKDAERQAAKDKAQALAERVRKAPKTFAEVAKAESQDPGSAAKGGDLGFFGPGMMVKPFEEAAYAAKKGEIVGPVASDFGFHVIMVTDIKPADVKSLAEATPEIEAQLKKDVAARQFAESAENFSNIVYEQSTSLKPASDAVGVPVQTSDWISKGQRTPPPLGHPKLLAEIFSDDAIKGKRNTVAVEVAPSTLVSARVVEHKPAEQRTLEAVKGEIRRRLVREEATKMARAEGEAKLKELQAGKDAGLKWPAPLAVNRQKPGGLFPQVIDQVFRADPKKLPAYVGTETPTGFAVAQVTKVIELEKVEDAQREQLAERLRQAVAGQELAATLDSLRDRVGVTVRRGAFDVKPQ